MRRQQYGLGWGSWRVALGAAHPGIMADERDSRLRILAGPEWAVSADRLDSLRVSRSHHPTGDTDPHGHSVPARHLAEPGAMLWVAASAGDLVRRLSAGV